MKNVNLHIVNTAMQHHERCDGSGYPQGLKRKQIDPYAKMVAIADVYEAMTSTRVYRSPFCPFTVIEQFEEEGCLSLPGETGVTCRPAVVRVKAQDRNGKWCVYKGEGLKARCFCHELDHLDGIVFTQKVIKKELSE